MSGCGRVAGAGDQTARPVANGHAHRDRRAPGPRGNAALSQTWIGCKRSCEQPGSDSPSWSSGSRLLKRRSSGSSKRWTRTTTEWSPVRRKRIAREWRLALYSLAAASKELLPSRRWRQAKAGCPQQTSGHGAGQARTAADSVNDWMPPEIFFSLLDFDRLALAIPWTALLACPGSWLALQTLGLSPFPAASAPASPPLVRRRQPCRTTGSASVRR